MVISVRSYFTALRASGRLGRCLKLKRLGRLIDALALARETLLLLRAPHVVRANPAEGAVLLNLTMLTDDLASQVGQLGADDVDLRDSLQLLERLGDDASDEIRSMRSGWLPHLRARLGHGEGA